MTYRLSLSRTISADPARVFRALTSSREIRRWSGQPGSVQAKIGGKFSFFGGWVTGTVLAYQAPRVLSYTWLTSEWPDGALPSIVTFRLARAKGGTRVTLVHKGLPNARERKEHKGGWDEFFFDLLEKMMKERRA